MTRLFVAIDLPLEIKQRIVLSPERFAMPQGVKFSPLHNLHLTVLFLGESEVEKIAPLLKQIQLPCFNLSIHKRGEFNFSDGHSIQMLKVEGGNPLLELHQRTRELCSQMIHLKEEKYQYTPHVTLARSKPEAKAFSQVFVGETFAPEHSLQQAFNWQAKEFKLFQSIQTNDGPRYEAVECFPLISLQ